MPQFEDVSPPATERDTPLIPVRMVNEYKYCPRLAYLEWVQREWDDSAETIDGKHQHRRVDRGEGRLPPASATEHIERFHARSVSLSSERLGITAKLDLIEGERGRVIPVEYKRGKRPHVPRGAYEPELVQLCAQGLLLREHGYDCSEGVIYFAASRERVAVHFDTDLVESTMAAISGLRTCARRQEIPPPLEDSPKCPKCSLVAICLPDEVNFLERNIEQVRPLSVDRARAVPLYVQGNGAKVAKSGDQLVVTHDDAATEVRLREISQLALFGNIYLTTPTLHELFRRGIPVSWHSFGGWFLGHTVGTGHNNVEVRTAQYQKSFDSQACLALARGWVRAKIQNSRTLLRRNWRASGDRDDVLARLKRFADQAVRARSIDRLLGIEGAAATAYFQHLPKALRTGDDESLAYDFMRRNRRPPRDPINALLSYAYSLLTRTLTVSLSTVGLDPYRGFYHQPRYGRPALALDMMEPFRPLLADSTVVMVINNGEIRPSDFVRSGPAVNLSADGRKRFIAAFERRLEQEVTHPLFGYKLSYRRLLEVQARLLARHLTGELSEYPNFTTR